MSSTKELLVKENKLTLCIMPDGETRVDFFPVSFSEFMIDYVLSKEERERMALTECRKIYCG